MIGRSRKPPAASKKPRPSQRDKKHVDELLDEALEETFPASDPPAMLEPLPDSPPADEDGHGCLQPIARSGDDHDGPTSIRSKRVMPIWMVKATWVEDEAEASEQWEVSADSAHAAVEEVTSRLRFHPHHVEARLCSLEQDKTRAAGLLPGGVRRIPPQ